MTSDDNGLGPTKAGYEGNERERWSSLVAF